MLCQAKTCEENFGPVKKLNPGLACKTITQWQSDDYKSPIGNAKIVFIVAQKAE